ncbi:MAG TPA: hypothetical protein VL463_34365 [Kofleriaceae bacterium]|jgi:hypothetical protein|nr:hypothetical protein [Kofleriaceae bacterium]
MRLGTIAIVLGLGSVAHAGQGAAIPPIKLDFGAVRESVPGDVRDGGETMLGINLATIYPKEMPFDLGIGWINIGTGDKPGEIVEAQPLTSTGGSTTPGAVTDHRWTNGWYVEGSGLLAGGEHWRTWLSPRLEMFPGDDRTNYGAVLRVSSEVWTGGFYSDRGLGVCGVLALGAWAEAGVRQEPNATTAHVAATGLSLRVPLIVAD